MNEETKKTMQDTVLIALPRSEIVAFSNWNYPHTPDPSAPDPETSIRNEVLPSGSNDELVVEFLIKFLRARQKWLIPQEHYCLFSHVLPRVFVFPNKTPQDMRILAVCPAYQRKGIGSMLLKPILEIIDKDRAKTYITASPVGLGLYLKNGWKEVDEIHIDFGPYGGEKDRTAVLIREPKVLE